MLVDVALNPAEIALLPKRDLSQTACVVFDVLRATSSMITALAHGATEIYPVRTVREAHEVKARIPDIVLGGERFGDPIDGFDAGNNPIDYFHFSGRRIVTTTTNGTIALRNCDHAPEVWVGALLNLHALVDLIQKTAPPILLLVCAGTFETFALEDAYAAGLLISMLGNVEMTDAARTTLCLAAQFPNANIALCAARNGRALAAKGWQHQVDFCAQISCFNVVGKMSEGIVRRLDP